MFYFVYVLWSEKLSRRYVGSSRDVFSRFKQHNGGKSVYTSRGIPWILKYIEKYATNKQARQRERFLKSGGGRNFLDRLFNGDEGYPEAELPADCLGYDIF